jgi:hypothetical protein
MKQDRSKVQITKEVVKKAPRTLAPANCHGAPQSRSDQDGTPLTRITDEEEKL